MKLTPRYSSNYNVLKGYRVGSGKYEKDFTGLGFELRADLYATKLLKKGFKEVHSRPLYGKGKYVKVTTSKRNTTKGWVI